MRHELRIGNMCSIWQYKSLRTLETHFSPGEGWIPYGSGMGSEDSECRLLIQTSLKNMGEIIFII